MSCKGSLCLKCDSTINKKDVLICRGDCQRKFHKTCLLTEMKCDDCSQGISLCFICKSNGGVLVKCEFISCKKMFHVLCLNTGLWPQCHFTETGFICPAHVCHNCFIKNSSSAQSESKYRLLQCVRCPSAYHTTTECVPAGCAKPTSGDLVCPKHFFESRKKRLVCNTNWCFTCGKGGSLICCELCPGSYHVDCIKLEHPPDKFVCKACELGILPHYGEVQWVKFSRYRWWPALILYPCQIPDNIKRKKRLVGDFVVRFCGTNEHAWVDKSVCYPFQEEDDIRQRKQNLGTTNSIDGKFQLGIKEALDIVLSNNNIQSRSSGFSEILPPPSFSAIKSNKPYKDCPVYSKEHPVCDCHEGLIEPCGENSDCINRVLQYECDPSSCPAKEKCQNQRFCRQLYPNLLVKATKNRGWGLFLDQDVSMGDFIIEYVGELITTEEYKTRLSFKNAEDNYYFMNVDGKRVIDAELKGNLARFMNHSCQPNCQTQKWTVKGDTRIGLFALENLAAGTELTFNYKFEAVNDERSSCHCGAESCKGYLGEKNLKRERNSSTDAIVNSQSKKHRVNNAHEQILVDPSSRGNTTLKLKRSRQRVRKVFKKEDSNSKSYPSFKTDCKDGSEASLEKNQIIKENSCNSVSPVNSQTERTEVPKQELGTILSSSLSKKRSTNCNVAIPRVVKILKAEDSGSKSGSVLHSKVKYECRENYDDTSDKRLKVVCFQIKKEKSRKF